jgi:hypothetical protein
MIPITLCTHRFPTRCIRHGDHYGAHCQVVGSGPDGHQDDQPLPERTGMIYEEGRTWRIMSHRNNVGHVATLQGKH